MKQGLGGAPLFSDPQGGGLDAAPGPYSSSGHDVSRPQVLRDWRGGNTKGNGRLTNKSKSILNARMAAFFGKTAPGASSAKPPTVKQKRLANKYWMMALDAALQGSFGTCGLKDFVGQHRAAPLPAGAKRYFVEISKLHEDLQRSAAGTDRRACVVFGDKRRRLEVCWQSPRPRLMLSLDMGSIGWASMTHLFGSRGGLRGWFEMDPPHRRHDNVLQAFNESDTTWARTEILLEQSMSSAPFGGAGHFESIKGAAEEFFSSFGPECELFQHFYPSIAYEMTGGALPPAFGTRPHMWEVWSFAKEAWPLHQKGCRTRSARWFQASWRESLFRKLGSWQHVFCATYPAGRDKQLVCPGCSVVC